MKMKKTAFLIVAVVAALGLTSGSPAFAADEDPAPDAGGVQVVEEGETPDRLPSVTIQTVIGKSKVSGSYVNRSNRLASCTVGSSGSTCTIQRSVSATRSVDVSLGITRGAVSSSLGFSAAESVSTSVSCNSPSMKAGQTWSAYPRGDRWSYKVSSVTKVGVRVVASKTSGTLYAFNPRANDVFCTL